MFVTPPLGRSYSIGSGADRRGEFCDPKATESRKNELCQRIGDRGSGDFFKDFRSLLCCAAPYEKLITNFQYLRPII
jgi:hypothetical protein